MGLLLLTVARRGGGLAKGHVHDQVALGTPLLDRERGADAFAAMLRWLGRRSVGALLLNDIVLDGPVREVLAAFDTRVLDTRQRAILRRNQGAIVTSFASAKKRKELRRQQRRLSEIGTGAYTSSRSPVEVVRATERFLALEAGGWKGRWGTALLADPSHATFTRTMTRLMAAEGRCRIDALEIDGVAVAMGIILTAGDRAHFWKTAFDERFASFSPGVQFALGLTAAQSADRAIAVTDSCALPDHPMIDRLWFDRMPVGDVMVAPPSTGRFAFERAYRVESAYRCARANVKSLYRSWVRHGSGG